MQNPVCFLHGVLSNSHASMMELNVQEKAESLFTVFQLATKLTDEEYWVMRLFSKENQEWSRMIFLVRPLALNMKCAVRDGTLTISDKKNILI